MPMTKKEHEKELRCYPAALTVTEVAEMSGFGSLSDLYRHFQKKHGVSPTEFRRMMKKGTK